MARFGASSLGASLAVTAPSLRQRKVEETKRSILEALVDVIREGGVSDFSIQAVADRAGVSHRTVYRYFPTREALLEDLGAWCQEFMRAEIAWRGEGLPVVAPEELSRMVRAAWRTFYDNPDHTVAYVVLSASLVLPARKARSKWFAEVLAPRTRHLSPHDARAATAIIRALSSSVTWHHVVRHGRTSSSAAIRAASWAVETLVADLAAGGGPCREEET